MEKDGVFTFVLFLIAAFLVVTYVSSLKNDDFFPDELEVFILEDAFDISMLASSSADEVDVYSAVFKTDFSLVDVERKYSSLLYAQNNSWEKLSGTRTILQGSSEFRNLDYLANVSYFKIIGNATRVSVVVRKI